MTLRIGHFPNITHVQALVAHGLSRKGQGWFEQRLGPEVKVEWFIYNAGPSAMEAIFADSIDLTYVGPSPAINAYAKARGEDIRIVAGAAEGGAALVEESDSVTTVLVTGVKFLGSKRDIARRIVAAHEELTAWIKAYPEEAQAAVREELTAETCTEIKPALVARAWSRITLTSQVSRDALEQFAAKAREAGFLRTAPNLSRLVERP